ncbi:MAG: glycosyltransferase family 9 protein [Verrucomicrobiae bacterium]|nr:glycosyltransferase family 9 protein [Verrucomicrobiae bacterium]
MSELMRSSLAGVPGCRDANAPFTETDQALAGAHAGAPLHWRQRLTMPAGLRTLLARWTHALGRRFLSRTKQRPPAVEEVKRILVMQFHYIGDVFFATPAIAALRRRFPNAALDALVKTRGRDVLLGNPHVNDILVFDRLCNDRTREPRTDWAALTRLARRLRGYDLLVDFTGVRASCALAALARPRWSVGFSKSGFGFVFDRELWPVQEWPLFEKCNALVALAGADARGLAPRIWLDDATPGGAGDVDILLHVGAGFPLKLWPVEKFRVVAEHYRARGLRVALVGGPGDPAEVTNLSVRQVAAWARRCRCYVGLDTGLTHIVASLGVPTVTIYGPTNPRFSFWPWPNARRVGIKLACSPGENEEKCAACRPMVCRHHLCMRMLEPSRVIQEIEPCLAASFTSSPS